MDTHCIHAIRINLSARRTTCRSEQMDRNKNKNSWLHEGFVGDYIVHRGVLIRLEWFSSLPIGR